MKLELELELVSALAVSMMQLQNSAINIFWLILIELVFFHIGTSPTHELLISIIGSRCMQALWLVSGISLIYTTFP